MSITIRLAKFGRKKAHSFRIVVANTRGKRNGKFLDTIGFYNPSQNPVGFEYDKEKFTEWKSKGALVTKSVEQLVNGTYEQKAFDPHKKLLNSEQEKAAE